MSPTGLVYKELGLELVEPLQDWPCGPWQPPMGEEKKDKGEGDPFKKNSRRISWATKEWDDG